MTRRIWASRSLSDDRCPLKWGEIERKKNNFVWSLNIEKSKKILTIVRGTNHGDWGKACWWLGIPKAFRVEGPTGSKIFMNFDSLVPMSLNQPLHEFSFDACVSWRDKPGNSFWSIESICLEVQISFNVFSLFQRFESWSKPGEKLLKLENSPLNREWIGCKVRWN